MTPGFGATLKVDCNCAKEGSTSEYCDQNTGQCTCKDNFEGLKCDKCKPNHFNFPTCEGTTV